jgi:phage-related protein
MRPMRIKLILLITLSFLSLTLTACHQETPAEKLVKANSERTATYHRFQDQVNLVTGRRDEFVANEIKKCQAEGKLSGKDLTLRLDASLDLTCQETPKEAKVPPASGASAASAASK